MSFKRFGKSFLRLSSEFFQTLEFLTPFCFVGSFALYEINHNEDFEFIKRLKALPVFLYLGYLVPHVLNRVCSKLSTGFDEDFRVSNRLYRDEWLKPDIGLWERFKHSQKYLPNALLNLVIPWDHDEESEIKSVRQLAKKYPTYHWPFRVLYYYHMCVGEPREAHKNLKISLKNFFRSPFRLPFEFSPSLLQFGSAERMSFVNRIAKPIGKLIRSNHPFYLDLAELVSYIFNGDYDYVFEIPPVVIDNPGNLEIQVQYASLIETIFRNSKSVRGSWIEKRKKQWEKCVVMMLKDTETRFQPLGETQHEVFHVDKDFVFKANASKERLERESDLALKVGEILYFSRNQLESKLFFDVADPILICDDRISGRYVYSMEFCPGQTLMEVIEGEDKGDLDELVAGIVEYMALLHAKLPVFGRKCNLAEKTRDRLVKLSDELPADVRRLFGDNLHLCYKGAEDDLFVFDDDGHPEQWIVDATRITRVDLEERGSVNPAIGLVNLFEYVRSPEFNQLRDQNLDRYAKCFKKFGGRDLVEGFEFRYLHSVLPRIISLFSAWSLHQRPSMREKRVDLVLNARDSLMGIEKKYPEYYKSHEDGFTNLQTAIEGMLKVV